MDQDAGGNTLIMSAVATPGIVLSALFGINMALGLIASLTISVLSAGYWIWREKESWAMRYMAPSLRSQNIRYGMFIRRCWPIFLALALFWAIVLWNLL